MFQKNKTAAATILFPSIAMAEHFTGFPSPLFVSHQIFRTQSRFTGIRHDWWHLSKSAQSIFKHLLNHLKLKFKCLLSNKHQMVNFCFMAFDQKNEETKLCLLFDMNINFLCWLRICYWNFRQQSLQSFFFSAALLAFSFFEANDEPKLTIHKNLSAVRLVF